MKMHPRHCKMGEKPCKQEHAYICPICEDTYTTEEATHYYSNSGETLPSKYWPACSLRCYRTSSPSSTNPNGLSWNDIEVIAPSGVDPDEAIEFDDPDVDQFFEGHISTEELQALIQEQLEEQEAA